MTIRAVISDMYETLVTQFCSLLYSHSSFAHELGILHRVSAGIISAWTASPCWQSRSVYPSIAAAHGDRCLR